MVQPRAEAAAESVQWNERRTTGRHNLVVGQTIIAERSSFAVFEPLLADLVAPDVEALGFRRNALKILGLVNKHATIRLAVGDLLHHIGACYRILS